VKLVLPSVLLIVACLVTAAVAERQSDAYSEMPSLVSKDQCIQNEAYGLLERPTPGKVLSFCAAYADLSERDD